MDNWGQGTFTLSVSRLYRRAITVTHQIDLLVFAFGCFWASVWVLFAQYPFQTIQRHIGKAGTDRAALRRTLLRRVDVAAHNDNRFGPQTWQISAHNQCKEKEL